MGGFRRRAFSAARAEQKIRKSGDGAMREEENAVRGRLFAVRERIADAARAAGRSPEEIRLVAVSKFHPARAVEALAAAGQEDFGESYVQEALSKQSGLARFRLRWHFIGHLQTNKAGRAAGRFCLVHGLDSLRLAGALDAAARERGLRQRVLIQVDTGGEGQKHGVRPADLPALAEAAAGMEGLALEGLMCLPPFFENGELARPHFALLRELRERLRARLGLALPELSMGMSGDFEQAVAEGATCVRIGTDIFGPRPEK
jgi:pyridoxal phosphate enzyme (YggS family)